MNGLHVIFYIKTWLSFSPIPNYTAAFYSITVEDVSMFSILYSATSLIAGFASILVLDICGLKVAVSAWD